MAGSPSVRGSAAELARELALPLAPGWDCAHRSFALLLVVCEGRLELQETGRRASGPVSVDFVGGATGYRRVSARSRRQPIARAIGRRGGPITVVDATAGLGRDSFLLACLGCTVVAVERSPVLGALLRDGLVRAAAHRDHALRAIVDRITLTVDDARRYLGNLDGDTVPDVVYLDPMYPERKKSALAKKEMRVCRQLVGGDEDAGELLEAARRVARRRVVVKRHASAPALTPGVAVRYTGRSVRYDLYLPVTPGP